MQINRKTKNVMVKVLNKHSRLQYKTEAEYFDEKNLTKPLVRSKNAELYDAFFFNIYYFS